ncbi:MAG: protein kinase domain-containing protein [Aridibacter sp.]
MKLTKDTMISHYRILSKIGAGGMGEVYLAQDTKLNRQVALKILPTEFAKDKDRMTRFVREAQSASALNHPNIITIHEIGEFDGTNYIATEFIDGKTLDEYAKDNPLNLESALEIAIQTAAALEEAHEAGIVHRDIKPDNIMVRSNGLVKILDFGIAKLSEEQDLEIESEDKTAIQSGTTPGMIIGTANYMSPEQARGKGVDHQTDIFSFGVVLYEMLAGKLPFEGETAMEMIGAILKDEPKPFDVDVPNEISAIINKCLSKDRNERYQTIKDLLIDLKDTKQNLELQNLMERTISPDKEEPKTQILQATTVDEVIQTATNQTVVSNTKTKYVAVGLLTLLLTVGGFFGYRYFASTNQIESIAVMPFVNESGNEDVEYLSDGDHTCSVNFNSLRL